MRRGHQVSGTPKRTFRLREGYHMDDVDAFLDLVEETAARGGDVPAVLRGAAFRRVTWRAGYDIAEVEDFVQEMREVEWHPPTPASAPDAGSTAWAVRGLVERVRFTPVRLREGYDMADVDRLLDAVVAAAERGEPVGPVIDAARFTPVRVREGYDMGEVDRFLTQLKGAGPTADDPGVVQEHGAIQEQRGLVDRVLEKIRPRS